MFDRILVPVDGSSRGIEATEVARHLADRFAAQLVLLRVEGALASLGQMLADNQALAQQASALRAHGLDARHTVSVGRPDRAIEHYAQTERAQLIVLAPHHRSHLEAIWHPSVTARLLGHTAVPLLAWPEQEPGQCSGNVLHIPGSLVLVPLDGSALAEQALPFAAAFAQAYARPLLLVRVVPLSARTEIGPEVHHIQRELQATEEQHARAYLSALRRRLSQQDDSLHVQFMLLTGEPWRELLRCAQTHDGSLIVMSTHGRTGIQRALLGSVAAHLVGQSPLPVMVVPRGATCAARGTSATLEIARATPAAASAHAAFNSTEV